MSGMISRPCGTYPMPRRARSCDFMRVISVPLKRTVPLRGGLSPMMLRRSVVLPAPLRPSTPISPAGSSSSETLCRMWLVP